MGGVSARTIFITGTDTGVGKTVLATLLTAQLRKSGLRAAGLKPVCSGGREDARALHEIQDGELTLDEVNPWHFRAPIAPLLAARRVGKRLQPGEVLRYIRSVAGRFEVVVVEGAGGLLSPLGEGFDSRDMIVALRALPVVVCPNRLGAVNQVRLVLEALPAPARSRSSVVLMQPEHPDNASRDNGGLLGELTGLKSIYNFPHLPQSSRWETALLKPNVRRLLTALAG
jgi:dethiobiotin synthetase